MVNYFVHGSEDFLTVRDPLDRNFEEVVLLMLEICSFLFLIGV